MEIFDTTEQAISSVLIIILYAIVFLFAKWINDLLTPYSVNRELTQTDNHALAISLTGYLAGITIIFLSVINGPHVGLWEDLIAVGGYSIGGVFCLNLARIINDKLILRKFSNIEQIIKFRNSSAGLIQGASYIASGLVIGGAVSGEGGGPALALIFFAIGQVILIVFALLYEKFISYSVHDEVEKGNLAAGFGFAGGLIAIGIIAMKAVSGDFIGWSGSLLLLAFDVSLVIVYLVVVRFFFDKLIIPHSDLNHEIANDKNIGAGLLEMFVSIGFSLVLFFTL
ncbi:DUF350 domain-containing protein [Chondrinema litorale]|uniref:DUF350 domain-containing protein n=1 Tax=Chondrinema litorale TaxID=2994555 RepID=UPI0025449BE5|nr:DUF350 domain-containing protein [Chondrinema litorale]UZR95441.1 DUF350 domain-containing protein [Chondrinema litorale]